MSFLKLFFLIIVASCTLSACMIDSSDRNTAPSSDTGSSTKYQQKLTDAERIELIRERRKELDSIRKGDFFLIKNNPEEALSYYLQVAEKLPDDVILQKKI